MVVSRRKSVVLVAALLVWACVLLWPRLEATPLTGLPDEALAATFDADMRNVVYRWNEADPRSDTERKTALFDFVYQTYDSSAWVPQSLFDQNLITQTVVGSVDAIVRDRVGLVLWRDNPRVVAFGMAPSRPADRPLMWTVNCLVCHTAEIDGVTYLGAGTKVFDDRVLGEALKLLARESDATPAASRSDDQLHIARALRILTSHHHDKIDSLTRARSTAFAASPSSCICGHMAARCRPSTRWDAVIPKRRRCGIRRRSCREAAGTPTAASTAGFRSWPRPWSSRRIVRSTRWSTW